MNERAVDQLLASHVRALGGMYIRLTPTRAGVPDRMVILPGRAPELIELKTTHGKLRVVQEVWHERAASLGTTVTVLRGPDEVNEWARLRSTATS